MAHYANKCSTAFRLEEGNTVTVNNLRRIPAADSILRLDESALRTLRIFATDHHPLVANTSVKGKSSQKAKEGFSLFTLLDRTRSKAGRERLRAWMTRPLRDAAAIRRRHVGMELFLRPACRSASSLLRERLAEVGSVDALLLRMQRCCAPPADLLVLGRTLDAAHAIVAVLGRERRERAGALDAEEAAREAAPAATTADGSPSGPGADQRRRDDPAAPPSVAYVNELLRRCHVPVLRGLRERLRALVDEELTAEAKDRVVIHYGVHEELDRAKETFETLDGEIVSDCKTPATEAARGRPVSIKHSPRESAPLLQQRHCPKWGAKCWPSIKTSSPSR